jgi:hypothetical protein
MCLFQHNICPTPTATLESWISRLGVKCIATVVLRLAMDLMEQSILDTNAGKQLFLAVTDV